MSVISDGVPSAPTPQHASGRHPPKYLTKPRVRIHCQDNWKTAHGFMRNVGINMYGIEPAGEPAHTHTCLTLHTHTCLTHHIAHIFTDLANVLPAAIHNMFNAILKWEESR